MNRDASDEDRIRAFGLLRGMQDENGQEARSHDAILAVLDIAEHSNDEKTRYKVYINLHGASDVAARDGMLRALANDPSPKVREKIAGDLDSLVGDPLVDNALRTAADGDSDSSVRARASKTLAGNKK